MSVTGFLFLHPKPLILKVQKDINGKSKIQARLWILWNVFVLSNLNLFMSEQEFFSFYYSLVTVMAKRANILAFLQ